MQLTLIYPGIVRFVPGFIFGGLACLFTSSAAMASSLYLNAEWTDEQQWVLTSRPKPLPKDPKDAALVQQRFIVIPRRADFEMSLARDYREIAFTFSFANGVLKPSGKSIRWPSLPSGQSETSGLEGIDAGSVEYHLDVTFMDWLKSVSVHMPEAKWVVHDYATGTGVRRQYVLAKLLEGNSMSEIFSQAAFHAHRMRKRLSIALYSGDSQVWNAEDVTKLRDMDVVKIRVPRVVQGVTATCFNLPPALGLRLSADFAQRSRVDGTDALMALEEYSWHFLSDLMEDPTLVRADVLRGLLSNYFQMIRPIGIDGERKESFKLKAPVDAPALQLNIPQYTSIETQISARGML